MKKHLIAALTAAVTVASLHAAPTTVVNYSTGGTNVSGYTGFFNTADGWNNSGNPVWEGQEGWTGTGTGADAVGQFAGLTPSSPANNGSGSLGVFIPALPLNTTTPYVQRTFSPGLTSVSGFYTNVSTSFVAEWAVLEFGPTPWDDSFTFDLRNAANTVSLLNFTLGPQNSPTLDYNVAASGSSSVNQFDVYYGSLIRMQVDVSSTGSYSGSFQLLDGVTRNVLSSGSLNSGSMAGGAVASDIGALRFGWQLASGDANDPGTLGTMVNEFTFTSTGDPIPEPGTWAVGALLLGGAALTIYRRRKAAEDQATA